MNGENAGVKGGERPGTGQAGRIPSPDSVKKSRHLPLKFLYFYSANFYPMSEESNLPENEETTPAAEEQQPKAKPEKPVPPPVRREVKYRFPNGEWADVEDKETIDKSLFFKMIERELTKDGELISESEYDEDGTELARTVNVYNEDGKIVSHELYNEGMLAEKVGYKYDEQGRVSEETREFEEGFPLTTFFTYDSENRVIEKRVDDSEGELQKKETFAYHPTWKDKVIRHVTSDEEGNLSMEEETEWEERNGEIKPKRLLIIDHSFGTKRRTEFFDPRTREDHIAYATYNEREKVIEYVKVLYDEEGREIEEHSVSVNESDNFKVYYEYDEYDRVVAQEQHQADKIISKINRRFNAAGLAELVAVRSFGRGMYVDLVEYEYHS
jgi:hypothetical protein